MKKTYTVEVTQVIDITVDEGLEYLVESTAEEFLSPVYIPTFPMPGVRFNNYSCCAHVVNNDGEEGAD